VTIRSARATASASSTIRWTGRRTRRRRGGRPRRRAAPPSQATGRRPQHRVADVVALAVVEHLELVEIDEQHRGERAARRARCSASSRCSAKRRRLASPVSASWVAWWTSDICSRCWAVTSRTTAIASCAGHGDPRLIGRGVLTPCHLERLGLAGRRLAFGECPFHRTEEFGEHVGEATAHHVGRNPADGGVGGRAPVEDHAIGVDPDEQVGDAGHQGAIAAFGPAHLGLGIATGEHLAEGDRGRAEQGHLLVGPGAVAAAHVETHRPDQPAAVDHRHHHGRRGAGEGIRADLRAPVLAELGDRLDAQRLALDQRLTDAGGGVVGDADHQLLGRPDVGSVPLMGHVEVLAVGAIEHHIGPIDRDRLDPGRPGRPPPRRRSRREASR
jgi:hypothetical protein